MPLHSITLSSREASLLGARSGRKAQIGDFFEIPIDAARVGYGQVIANRSGIYLVAVFRTAHPKPSQIDPSVIGRDDIALLAECLDAKIWNGDWPIVGNMPPDSSRIPLPKYKVAIGRADNWHVESYDGKRRRPARPSELDSLRYREVCSPMMLQMALQALHQLAPRLESYGRLDYEFARRSSEVVL